MSSALVVLSRVESQLQDGDDQGIYATRYQAVVTGSRGLLTTLRDLVTDAITNSLFTEFD